jgi:uncharacterized protein HemX
MLEVVAAALVAALAGGVPVVLREFVETVGLPRLLSKSQAGRQFLKILSIGSKTDTPKPEGLFSDLAKTSSEMDRIFREIEAVTKERQANVAKAESQLQSLAQQEEELKKKVEGLKNVPLPAAEFFAKMVEEREKKSAWRDYLLFLAGVVVSAIVAILLKRFGLG